MFIPRSGILVLLLAGFIGQGCAHDVSASFPGEAKKPGTLTVLFSSAVPNATVAIDGKLICDDEHTRKVVISDVPAGKREVRVTASHYEWSKNIEHSEKIKIPSGGETVLQIVTPSRSTAAWIYSGIAFVGLIVLVSL